MERYFAAGTGVTRRQQLDRYLRVNGNFYVWRAEFVRRLASPGWTRASTAWWRSRRRTPSRSTTWRSSARWRRCCPGRDHAALARPGATAQT